MAIHKLFSVMLTEMYTSTHICMYVYYVYLLSLLTGSSGTAVTGLSTSIGRAHSRTASCSHHTRIVMLSAWSIVGWMYLMLCVLVSWSAVTLMCRGKCSVSKPTSTKGVPSPLSHFSSAAQAFEDEMSTQDRTPRSTRYVSHYCEYIVQKHVSFIDASPEAASFIICGRTEWCLRTKVVCPVWEHPIKAHRGCLGEAGRGWGAWHYRRRVDRWQRLTGYRIGDGV